VLPLARSRTRQRRRCDASNARCAEQPLIKRITAPTSRLAAEIEKLHLELSGEGERKRCKEYGQQPSSQAKDCSD
jgi:hypothetical protein